MRQKAFRASLSAFRIVLLGWMVLSASWLAAQQKSADLIFHNGKVLTVDARFSVAQAVAVVGNEITAVGGDQDVMKLASPNTTVIDLKGRTVIPGLIDTHRHIFAANYDGTMTPEKMRQYPVDWRAVKTTGDVLNQVKGLMDKYKFKPGQWVFIVSQGLQIMGAGSGQETQTKILFSDLNRWELDKVAPDNPMLMTLGTPDQNGMLINSKALDTIMDKYGDFLKRYGRLWLDASGRPDGHIEPPATRLVRNMTPGPDPADLGPQFKMTLDELAAMGITTVSTQLTDHLLEPYQWLESQGQMTVRLGYGRASDFGAVVDLTQMRDLARLQGTGTDKIWVTSITAGAVDGAGSRTCMSVQRQTAFGAIDEWWPIGQCHMDSEYRGGGGAGVGAARTPANYFRDWVLESGNSGVRFANTHVGGDRSVSLMLSLADQAQKQGGPNATRGWALDHCSFVNPRDFKESRPLGNHL